MRKVRQNGLGWDVNAGLKPLAQSLEAISTPSVNPLLRADERVGLNRLLRTQAGCYAIRRFGR